MVLRQLCFHLFNSTFAYSDLFDSFKNYFRHIIFPEKLTVVRTKFQCELCFYNIYPYCDELLNF